MRKLMVLMMVLIMVSACGNQAKQRPILLQGAMDLEVDTMVASLNNSKEVYLGKYVYYEGELDGYPVIVSKTNMGIANAAVSTTLAIEAFNPIIIINQGTSGGHDPKLHTMDLVIGENVVNMGAWKSFEQGLGDGVDPAQFEQFRIESLPEGKGKEVNVFQFPSNKELVDLAFAMKDEYRVGSVVKGTIGTADEWNNQLDRIAILNEKLGTSVEEMETSAVGQMALNYDIPYLGIRVLSNTAIHAEDFDPNSAIELQHYVVKIAKAYIKTLG